MGHQVSHLGGAARTGGSRGTKANIFGHGEMGEKGIVLHHEGNPAIATWAVNALLGIEQNTPIQDNPTLVRRFETRQTTQGQAFPRTGCPQNADGSGRGLKVDLELKGAPLPLTMDGQGRGVKAGSSRRRGGTWGG